MNTHAIANLLISSLCVGLLVRLYFWEYRDYRVFRTRQKLFRLRNELFALAEEGQVPFETPAYGMLRMMLNGAIRFAHRASLLHVLFTHTFLRRSPGYQEVCSQHHQRWERSLEKLGSPAREKVEAIRRSYVQTMIEQTVLSSILLFGMVVPIFCVLALARLSRSCMQKTYDWLVPKIAPELDVITSTEAEMVAAAAA